jgi:carboxyl-terminal processing protease
VASDIPLPSFDEWVPIGESDLPHALPWDAIVPSASSKPFVPPERKRTFEELIPILLQNSKLRQQTLPEFAVLDTRIRLFRQKLDHEEFSLDMLQRKKERREESQFQYDIQKKIDAISEQPFFVSTLISLPSTNSSAKNPLPSKKTDPSHKASFEQENDATNGHIERYDTHLRECLRILQDWIHWQNTNATTS